MKGIWGVFFLENMRRTIKEKKRIFFGGELEDRGRRLRERKKESSGRILVDFLNEIQKKIVDMEIMFPGGTSKERIG